MQKTAVNPKFMQRCLDLARLGKGHVSPNPMVGAVLEFEGKIIGEGWHEKYGEAHAEVNAIRSVKPENQALISKSTLYCSLEPCFHFGKTPPCVDLVLEKKIPRVVIASTDPNPKVAGQSIEKMRSAGVEVIPGILEKEARKLNRPFFTWISEKRPFVVLKWAQSADGFLAKKGERTVISGAEALRLVHKWRTECDAIFVGKTTALTDNPRLDNRLFPGKTPLRIALDVRGELTFYHNLLDDSRETWILGKEKWLKMEKTRFLPTTHGQRLIPDLLKKLHESGKAILLVEGGANILNQFLEQGIWDEIRVLTNEKRLGEGGVPAPKIPAEAVWEEQFKIGKDSVACFARQF